MSSSRSFNPLQAAAFVAVGGSCVVVFAVGFTRNLSASRFSEAVDGVGEIATGAVNYAANKPPPQAFPPASPLTPKQVPRGERVEDPPGTWDHLTWAALGFKKEHPHYFSFVFESKNGVRRSVFAARAHGDLDGDGQRSTFEVQGETTLEGGPRVLPGLYVEREVE